MQMTIPGMANRGRRQGTSASIRTAIIGRTKEARRRSGLSQEEMAKALTEASGRHISPDTYRKWEKAALLPHDLLVPFCDIARCDMFELLTGVPFTLGGRGPARSTHQQN